MIKKTITYKDFEDNEVVEDCYFNLTKAEVAEMDLSHKNGGWFDYLKNAVSERDGTILIAAFKKLILKSYGRRSEDGKSFTKSDSLSSYFEGTGAYSELFMELIQDEEAVFAFIKGILPSDLSEKAVAAMNAEVEAAPVWIQENRKPTANEVRSMTHTQLLEAMAKSNAESD